MENTKSCNLCDLRYEKCQVLNDERRDQGVLGRAGEREPLFVLRAHDLLAPSAVQYWAELALSLGVPAERYESAMLVAQAMRRWPERKLPSRYNPGGGR